MKCLLDSQHLFIRWFTLISTFFFLVVPGLSEILILPQEEIPAEIVSPDFADRDTPIFLPQTKADHPGDLLVLPFFEVDTTRGNGTTTLYALRNARNEAIEVEIHYCDLRGTIMKRETVHLPARQIRSVNLRDVTGLTVDEEGVARGMVTFITNSFPDGKSLVGDFFQIDTAKNYATGDRLITLYELCDLSEARFLDFGDGTHLRILISQPRGMDLTQPTFTVTPIREDGTPLGMSTVYTDQVLLELNTEAFTQEDYGTLIFDFSNGRGGYVFAEYSADGRFSIGLNSACLEFEKRP